ncbi:MAG: ATP-binding cassette domain-containing protein [Acidimicrobiia bacterium]
MQLLGLHELRDGRAGEVSQGQRQVVPVARALVEHPKVVSLDESADLGAAPARQLERQRERRYSLRAADPTGLTC